MTVRFVCPELCTLKAQVSHVQDGGQQLGDLPVLGLCEHEDLHGRQDAGVVAQVVTAVTLRAVALWGVKQSRAMVGLSAFVFRVLFFTLGH